MHALKNILNKSLPSFIFSLCWLAVNAQDKILETFIVHLSQPVYTVGESIRYKVYQTNFKSSSAHSTILFTNLHDQSGFLLNQQMLKLEDGMAHGLLEIPLTLKEGLYYLSFFSKWNLQFNDNDLYCIEIPIYSPLDSDTENYEIMEKSTPAVFDTVDSNLTLMLDNKTYPRSSQVNFDIASKVLMKGSLSVTVHAMHNLNTAPVTMNGPAYHQYEKTEHQTNILIEGRLIDPNSENPIFSDVISLYQVGSNKFLKASCKSGIVQIPYSNFSKSVTFQIFNMNPFETTIPDFELLIPGEKLLGLSTKKIVRNYQIANYLKTVAESIKIGEIFKPEEKESVQRVSSLSIPFKADKVYQMDKYHKIATLEEFMREVVAFARVDTENGQPTVRLKNRETNREFMEKPWYLVDGYLTRNERLVLSIPFKNLMRVEFFNTSSSILSQLDAIMIRSGLIIIYTNDNHLKSSCEALNNIFEFKGFAPESAVETLKKNEMNFRENPKFRHHLYWNPDISLNTKISFQTSELMGEYIIEVLGIDEKGGVQSTSTRFFVEFD